MAATFYQYIEDRCLCFKALTLLKPAPIPSWPPSSPPTKAPLLGSSTAARAATTVLFGINSMIGYLLMLAIMSYNGGVFIGLVIGLAAEYFTLRGGGEEDVNVITVENPCACA